MIIVNPVTGDYLDASQCLAVDLDSSALERLDADDVLFYALAHGRPVRP